MEVFTDPCPRRKNDVLSTLLGTVLVTLVPVLVDRLIGKISSNH